MENIIQNGEKNRNLDLNELNHYWLLLKNLLKFKTYRFYVNFYAKSIINYTICYTKCYISRV